MNHSRTTLCGTKEGILQDIRSIQYNDSPVYPNYPEEYEFRDGAKVFIITDIYRKVLDPGDENTPPTLSEDYYCHLILPEQYDTSHLLNIYNE